MKDNWIRFRKKLLFSLLGFLFSCGGDEEVESSGLTDNFEESVEAEVIEEFSQSDTTETLPPPILDKEEVSLPDPNGIYLPTSDEPKNGFPVFENREGFSLWHNGSSWRITDRSGGGKLVASGPTEINGDWTGGGVFRQYPDEEYEKDALFRLAVAYQGSSENLDAIRLFEQFVVRFPEDKLVAQAYLSLGDLSISEVNPDEQPSFEQISNARRNYSLVRKTSDDLTLISDAAFNEGGLLERVAENPEGLVNHYYLFDADKDEMISEKELSEIESLSTLQIADFDLNGDTLLDYGELFDLASTLTYMQIENLFKDYSLQFGDREGARISLATAKIGFACEKQGRPSEMLKLYFEDIRKYGNDPMRVGVDEILKKYIKKYDEYETLYGQTLDLLRKVKNKSEALSFTYRNRKGIEEVIAGTVEEIIKDRTKLLPLLSSKYAGMDSEIYSELAKLKGAVFINPKYEKKFQGYLSKYEKLSNDFPEDLSPVNAFSKLLQESITTRQKSLELRMRAILDSTDSVVGGNYNPNRSDFPAASPGALVWMAKKLLDQSSIEDAVAAMEQLLEVYGESGGEFLFDAHYLIGQAKEKERDYQSAAFHFESALMNSSWHEKANDARLRLGNASFEVGESTKNEASFEKARSSFKEIRGDSDATLEMRAQASFMMGECQRSLKDDAGAAFLYLETTLNFPSSLKWTAKSFEKAIIAYEKTGQTEQVSRLQTQWNDWERKYNK